ncbi:uncharacterized protein LOC126199322 [Schistocerca nitens]|uniref:uncharacterized protein LOC126199322 n=1 Tax=Schistocerca nitens TaxID=7011 RepID=UPI0021180CBA|nr:uncharacterized protein LOC126199322 [Schistocerca nitens]
MMPRPVTGIALEEEFDLLDRQLDALHQQMQGQPPANNKMPEQHTCETDQLPDSDEDDDLPEWVRQRPFNLALLDDDDFFEGVVESPDEVLISWSQSEKAVASPQPQHSVVRIPMAAKPSSSPKRRLVRHASPISAPLFAAREAALASVGRAANYHPLSYRVGSTAAPGTITAAWLFPLL